MRRRVARNLTGLLAASALIGGVLACGEDNPPATAPATAVGAAPEIVVTHYSSSTWNYYSAEEVISSEGGYDGFDRPDAYRSLQYTVERTLGADSTWSSVLNLAQNQPLGPPPAGEVYDYDLARIETNDAHSYFRMYDRAGVEIPTAFTAPTEDLTQGAEAIIPPGSPPPAQWPDPSNVAPPNPDPPPCGGEVLCRPASAAMSVAAAPASASRELRAWLDPILVTPVSRVRTRAHLERRLGRPTASVGSRKRFSAMKGDRQIEVLLDSLTGVIVEENEAVGGTLVAHTTHEYQQVEPGILLRTLTRLEVAADRPGSARRVITVARSNVKLGVLKRPGGGQ